MEISELYIEGADNKTTTILNNFISKKLYFHTTYF